MQINFKSNTFTLQSDGSLYWNKHKTLILGDLHLEKSSYFAKNGNFLPPYDSDQTLNNLKNKLKELDILKIILLGDIFHDKLGLQRLSEKSFSNLKYICKNFEVIWIQGNHDGDLVPENVSIKKNYKFDNIMFNHISNEKSSYEISAHYHPKVSFNLRGRKISKPCFLVDEKKIIIPSYGSLTGGLDVKNKNFIKKFSNNFSIYISNNENIFLINDNK